MRFLLIPVGYYVGSLLIGRLLYPLLCNSAGAHDQVERETYTWIGRIIGIIVAVAIVVNI